MWLLVFLRTVRRLLVTASVVLSSPSLVTLMKEALRSFETSVLTRATWHNTLEDAILHCYCRENLKSCNASDIYLQRYERTIQRFSPKHGNIDTETQCLIIVIIHLTLPIALALNSFVRFEIFTALTMKNGVFWDVTPCGSCNKRRFGGT
jgi:hypothetical protein